MKLTKRKLKQIIKEELENVLLEFNKEECSKYYKSYLEAAKVAIFKMWKADWSKCSDSPLENEHQKLMFFLAAVERGAAKIPETRNK